MKESVSSEHYPSGAVFHEPANAILRMTWCIQCFDGNIPDFKALAIFRCFRNSFAVFPTYYRLAFEYCELWR